MSGSNPPEEDKESPSDPQRGGPVRRSNDQKGLKDQTALPEANRTHRELREARDTTKDTIERKRGGQTPQAELKETTKPASPLGDFCTPNCGQFSDYQLSTTILGQGAYAVVKEALHKPSGV